MIQHAINPSNPPILDSMSAKVYRCTMAKLVDKKCVTAYEIPDSDRAATLLLMDDGTCYEIDCRPVDLGYLVRCESDPWEVVVYDVTLTPTGGAMRLLEPGHWGIASTPSEMGE